LIGNGKYYIILSAVNLQLLKGESMCIKIISNEGKPLSEEDILNAEQEMQILIPKEYRTFLKKHNGGHPCPSDFYRPQDENSKLGKISDSVGNFYGLEGTYNLIWVHREYKDRIPSEMLPIAGVGGCQICLCREGKNQGKIYFWDSEEENLEETQPYYDNIHFLANSLEEFLSSLL
jgi:hypothetical protein